MHRRGSSSYILPVVTIEPPSSGGTHIGGHVSLHDAGRLARGLDQSAPFSVGAQERTATAPPRAVRSNRASAGGGASYQPHTAVRSSGNAQPDQWDAMLNRLGVKYNVPPLFLKAVMLSESGGNPDAIGDNGHSVGLFQLHDRGYGYGMGDARFDPEVNAERATQGLAEAWHAGQREAYKGEYAVRAAYDYSFNPGGGFAYQGDSVVRHYNQLLAEQGLPPLS
jgi:soluble lytic murein transglycosylase-like protein